MNSLTLYSCRLCYRSRILEALLKHYGIEFQTKLVAFDLSNECQQSIYTEPPALLHREQLVEDFLQILLYVDEVLLKHQLLGQELKQRSQVLSDLEKLDHSTLTILGAALLTEPSLHEKTGVNHKKLLSRYGRVAEQPELEVQFRSAISTLGAVLENGLPSMFDCNLLCLALHTALMSLDGENKWWAMISEQPEILRSLTVMESKIELQKTAL